MFVEWVNYVVNNVIICNRNYMYVLLFIKNKFFLNDMDFLK